ncbi:poly(hydroxyalkanoate) depolymerase family esterase [Duganella sp. 1224]|uniref:extracellular catalytic domain type 1 short-chain-length polyhydroxyalkanoate depolymerase n=1 Tax=Duganella sp. 1224 TaxID=2587052 RepID=UPI0017BB227B|nr:PHB depolymerase family esterase [Duganella sp. 1224]NYE61295.1 poly(hydroxyalkanoate) depolymerase family esterase [Duganella sp. 1224]
MARTGKLLRSLIRAGTRTAKLFAAVATPPKPTRQRAKPTAKPAATLIAKPTAKTAATPRAKPRAARAAASSVPPAAAIGPGKWLTAHVPTTGGQRMNYWLYLPNHLPERAQSKGMPLVVMLHGCHQTATQFAQGTRMNLWAEKKGYAVLYPQQLTTIQPQRCWKWYDRATQEGGGDVPSILAMIHKVLTHYPIDRSRIYVAGISAGAGMANILALNHPRLFAAVGLHSGPVFGAGHNTLGALGVMKHGAPGWRADVAVHELLQRQPQFPGMPAIVLQGAGDHVVRPINQLQLARQSMLLNRLSGDAKATHKPKGRHNAHQLHDFYAGRKLMLRVAHIEQLDHAWSGGDPAFPFNAKAGPDASKMLLDFFARHQRA